MRVNNLYMAILLAAAFAIPAWAQTPAATPAPSDNYVINSGFKNRVFDVHNRTPEELVSVLKLLTSGFKGAQLSPSNEFHTITVRDFPENIAAVEEALKRLDKPEAPRPDIELRLHVLVASNKDTGLGEYPADLKDVIQELQKTLNYKDYRLLTSVVQRTREGVSVGYLSGSGSAEITWPNSADKRICNYRFGANSVTISSPADIQLGNFNFVLDTPAGQAAIHSDLRIREGEKVVVGTAGFSDKALILVMSGRILR